MISSDNTFDEALRSRYQLQVSRMNGSELREVLYVIFGLSKNRDSLLGSLTIGFERYLIYLGDSSSVYSLEAVNKAVRGFFGDSAGRLVFKKIVESLPSSVCN